MSKTEIDGFYVESRDDDNRRHDQRIVTTRLEGIVVKCGDMRLHLTIETRDGKREVRVLDAGHPSDWLSITPHSSNVVYIGRRGRG